MAQYGIELAGKRNENILFAPTKQVLRGRWDNANVAHLNKSNDAQGIWLKRLSAEIPSIPGIAIVVDTNKKQGVIWDPLGLPENAEMLATINRVFKSRPDITEVKPHPDQKHSLDADGLKNWLYWMVQLVENDNAKVLTGMKPLTIEEVRDMPGRRLADPLNMSSQTLEAPDPRAHYGLYPFADERPVDGKPPKSPAAPAAPASPPA